MKFSMQRKLLVVGSLLVMAGSIGEVAAHNQAGSFTTGKRTAVDFYQVTCSAGTDHPELLRQGLHGQLFPGRHPGAKRCRCRLFR